MKDNKLNLLIILVAITIASVFIIKIKPKTEIEVTDSKRQIDSLTNIISSIESQQTKLDSVLSKYQDTVLTLNSKLDSTKLKITKIHIYYGTKIKSAGNYNVTELDSFFTNRYGK